MFQAFLQTYHADWKLGMLVEMIVGLVDVRSVIDKTTNGLTHRLKDIQSTNKPFETVHGCSEALKDIEPVEQERAPAEDIKTQNENPSSL